MFGNSDQHGSNDIFFIMILYIIYSSKFCANICYSFLDKWNTNILHISKFCVSFICKTTADIRIKFCGIMYKIIIKKISFQQCWSEFPSKSYKPKTSKYLGGLFKFQKSWVMPLKLFNNFSDWNNFLYSILLLNYKKWSHKIICEKSGSSNIKGMTQLFWNLNSPPKYFDVFCL